jgi:energy-coupling factor transport system permease protein
MLTAYSPGNTLIHRLDVRTKMLGFLGILILSFLFQNPVYQVFSAVLTVFLARWIDIPLRRILGMIVPLLPIVISIIIITGFTFTPQRFERASSQAILFYVLPGHRLGASTGGFLMGITFLLRLWCLLISSSVLTITTSMDDFTVFFQRMRVPAEISMMLTTALRFIPTLDKKRKLILEAQMARGMRFKEKRITGSIRSYLPIMIPLFINSILMANSLSMAMLNRGYGLSKEATPMKKQNSFTFEDFCSILLIVIIIATALVIRFILDLGIL